MRLKIFSEAIRIQEYLVESGTFHNQVLIDFIFPNDSTISTRLFVDDNKTKVSCTCKQGSINYDALCSHKLAVLFYFFRKHMRRIKQKW